MRYEDASGTFQASGPIANDDSDTLTAGSRGPATGNVITGEGTQFGSAGADIAAGAQVTALAGKGGEDTSFAGGKLSVAGEFGQLSVDAEGNYTYLANTGAPENVRDRFTYTLADNQGNSDTAALIVEIGKTPVVIKADAQQIVPGPDGVVTLPAGVELSDIMVVGRNLVVNLPDGTQLIIVDGAVFVPQLVLGGVEVPATNVAALLIGQEVQPAAGETPPSSGGNFALPPPPLDPGVPLGDLIPPTEYNYIPPEPQEVLDTLDEEPDAGAAAVQLDDDVIPGKGGNAGGTGDNPPDTVGQNIASGSLPGSGGDGDLEWSLSEAGAPAGFSYELQPDGSLHVIQVQGGNPVVVLTVEVNADTGAFEVTQNNPIRHATGEDENNVEFVIGYSVTDEDGDAAPGTLTINVDDDTPTASVTAGPDANVVLTTDDAQTIGVNSDTAVTLADFSGVFTGTATSAGADGAGAGTTSGYALAVTSQTSGLSSHGVPINLYMVGTTVVGATGSQPADLNDGDIVFTVAVDGNGVVTLTQMQQIDHAAESPSGSPFNDQFASMADGLVTLTRSVTVVDNDGDSVTASATVSIGQNLHFTDDGPTIDPTLNEVGGAVVDESAPVEAATIPLVGGYTAGDDPHLEGGLAIGKGSTSGPVIDANAAFGADGPANGGGVSYALEVLNATSGLTTTDGTAINLVELSNGVVVGVVDGTTTVAFAIQIDPTTGVVTVEQYLSLFHPDSPDNFDEPVFLDEGSLGVTVTATDFDGDTATSDAVDITSLIRFEDDGPSASGTANPAGAVTVDESGPTSASTIEFTGDEGDDEDVAGTGPIGRAVGVAAVVDGSAVFGADGPAADASLSYALALGGSDTPLTLTDGSAIELQLIDGVIVGMVTEGPHDGEAAFAIAIDPATGIATVELYLSLDHPDINDPNDSLPLGPNTVDVIVTATDGDGDQAGSDPIDISGLFNFLDDAPTADGVVDEEGAVTVDESGPTGASTIEFTGDEGDDLDVAGSGPIGRAVGGTAVVNASALFGADGPNADADISFELALGGSDTALTLTDGSAIELQLIDGVIVGIVTEGDHTGEAAFAIAIDPDTGIATVELYLSLDHPDITDHNDSLPLGPNTIDVIVTATDGDGDQDESDPVDISGLFNFLDDGPSVSATLSTGAAAVVDESEPVAVPTINTGPYTIPNDPHLEGGFAIGSGSTTGAVINANAAFGADGPAAEPADLSYNLVILNASSGLTTTEGDPINLVQLPSGVVVGVVDGGDFDGQAAFAISINSVTGVVTVEQYLSLDHPDFPDNFDEPVFLGENVLGATVTATDGDGDTDTSDAVDIGSKIRFEDDGPSATDEPQQDVQEGNQTVSGTFDFVGGADGASVTHLNDTVLVFAGDGWSQWINVDDGRIRAQADGDYQFESDASGSGVTSGTFTVTDGDGDQVEADWAFNITDANAPTAGISAARLDDDGLAGGNPLSTTNDIDANVGEIPVVNTEEDIFHGQLTLNFGGDGPGTVTFAAMDGQTGMVGTENVIYHWVGNTLTAEIDGGPRDGGTLFTLVLNTTTGEYTLTLNDNVIHAAGGDETSAPNVALTYTVTDSDNSPAGGVDGTLNITFNDDAPTLTNVQAGSGVDVDESDGFPTSDISASAVITATQAFGADGAAAANSVVYGLSITGGSPEPSGLETTVGGHDITLVQIDNNTIQGQYDGTNVAFTIDIGSDGRVTLTQNVALNHSDDGGPAPIDHNDTLDLAGLVNATITITDGDGDTATASAPIGDNLVFFDDGPNSEVDAQVDVPTVTLDETRPIGEDEGGPNVTTGLATMTVGFADNFQTADHGEDGPGVVSYQLLLSADGAGSGLYALDNSDTDDGGDGDGYGQGVEILLYDNNGVIEGRVGTDVYFTISVNASGEVTFTQLLNVWHADSTDDDDTSGLTAAGETLMLQQTVTDGDGDFDTSAIDLSDGVFFIEDDGPEIIAFTDATGDNTGATPSAEGIFEFDIGTDSPNGGNDDIFVDPDSIVIRINGVALDPVDNNIVFTPGVEDAQFARYSFSFEYATGANSTAPATGTLVFDKVNGTYTVTLTSGPIEGFTTAETEAGTAFVGYALNTNPADPDVLDDTQPQVAVTTILEETAEGNDGFYVQFTGIAAGNGGHETIDYDPVNPAPADGDLTTWTEGELFSEGIGADALWNSWVSVSGSANGVGGDQTNGPDALNFDLYSSDPGGTVGGLPTASASDMFLHFDTIGDSHDMVIVLKLWQDTDGIEGISAGDTFTTRALVVEGTDIYQFDANSEAATLAALAGTKWESVATEISNENGKNNDGLVIIESNDYDPNGDGWQIVGAQIVNASQTTDNHVVTGDGINYENAVGNTGGSTAVQNLSVVDDESPLKIMNIGFLIGTPVDQSFEIDFDVTITDADGDSETTSLTATIGDPPETLAATTMETSMVAANDDGSFSSLAFSGESEQLQKTAANSNTLTMAAAVAAAGLAESAAASPPADDQSFDAASESSASTQQVSMVMADDGGDEGGSAVSGLPETSEAEAPGNSGSHSRSAEHRSDNSLEASSNQPASDEGSSNQAANDQGPATEAAAANAVAPTVGMPSAEALLAAGLTGETAKHTGQVEEILADALGQGGAPTVDGLLAHLPGGLGELAALSNVASPAAGDVPGWDMAMHGGSGFAADVLAKLDAAMLQHHDAVQPAVNG